MTGPAKRRFAAGRRTPTDNPHRTDARPGDGPSTERNQMRTDPIDPTASDTQKAAAARRRRRRRRLAAGLVATTLYAVVAQAHAGAAKTSSRIRLAHFSPDAPAMDVYLVGFDGEEVMLDGLGFGEVSDYTPLEAGHYTFLLRRAGAPADSDPWVSASADLMEGDAYTFAAMGPRSDVKQVLVTDDLTPPPAGQAKVRLIQASSSAGEVDVSDSDGWVLAEATAFGSTTEYAAIPAGPRTVEVVAAGGARVVRELAFDAGTVNSLVVVEGSGGQPFELTSVVDATGVDVSADGPLGATQAAPVGGIATGGGGTASTTGGRGDGGLGTPALAGLALAFATVVVAGGTRLVRTGGRHSPARRRAGKHFAPDGHRTELTSSRRSA